MTIHRRTRSFGERARRLKVLLVDPVRLDDLAAHGLHAAVHGHVGLEDPARLAAVLRRLCRHVVVAGVEAGGDAGVLVLGLDAEREDPHRVDLLAAPQRGDPAEGQEAAVELLQYLVVVGEGQRDADRLALLGLGDHRPVLVHDRLQLLGVDRISESVSGTKPQLFSQAAL